MRHSKLTFQQVVALLEEAKIPCVVKRYDIDHDFEYSIEFGFNWPEELMWDVEKAFGGSIPSYVGLCGDSCGDNMSARKVIAGGQKRYSNLHRWG